MTLTPSEYVHWQVDGAHHTGRRLVEVTTETEASKQIA